MTTSKPEWQLRLYVAGTTARSVAALENLKRVCETHLAASLGFTSRSMTSML